MRGETARWTNDRTVTSIGKRHRSLSIEIDVGMRYARGGGDSGRAGALIGEILETERRLPDWDGTEMWTCEDKTAIGPRNAPIVARAVSVVLRQEHDDLVLFEVR